MLLQLCLPPGTDSCRALDCCVDYPHFWLAGRSPEALKHTLHIAHLHAHSLQLRVVLDGYPAILPSKPCREEPQ